MGRYCGPYVALSDPTVCIIDEIGGLPMPHPGMRPGNTVSQFGPRPKEKRHVLYYWFAVNIFHVSGRGNRVQLPHCVELKIRQQYPNPLGEAYTGYQY